MSLKLSKIRLHDGQWDGALEGVNETPPALEASHLGHPLDGLECREGDDGTWLVTLSIPPEILSDGIQTILITEQDSQDILAKLSFLSGDALDEDLRAELDVMRAELDMLKKAFRRHCAET